MRIRYFSLLLLALLLFSFCSCEIPSGLFGGKTVDEAGEVTLVLAKSEGDTQTFAVDLGEVSGDRGLFSVLDAAGISYDEDGGFLTRVGEIKQDASRGEYVVLWTSVERDADPSGWIENRTYDGVTLYPSLVGAKDMTVKDGAILYVGLLIYG